MSKTIRLPQNQKPSREEIVEALSQGLTTAAKLAHKWGRSAQSARNWLKAYELDSPDLVTKALGEREARREQEAQVAEVEVVEGELVDEETELLLPAVTSQVQVQASSKATPLAQAEAPETDLSAFDRLSARQQKAALIISGFGTNLTSVEVARRADVHADTVAEWRRDPLFQEAVLDLQEPLFRFEASLLVRQKLLELVATNKARPEDRRLLAEMSGLVGQQGAVTVNFTKVTSFKG